MILIASKRKKAEGIWSGYLFFLPSTLCVSRKAEYICLAEWQMERRFFSINGSRIVKCSDGPVKKGLEK